MTQQEKILIGKAIQKELSKAEKKGYRLFFLALKDHAKKALPYFDLYGSQSTLFALDTLIDQEPISIAYKEHYEATIQRMLSVNLRIMIRMVEGRYKKDKVTDQINIGFRSEEIIAQTAEEARKAGLGDKIVKISEYTRELIRKEIEQGLEKNLTKEQIARNITKVTEGTISKMRALRISRTETTLANSKSTEILSNAIPFEQVKIWLPRIDGKERPEHGAMLNKKPVPKKQPFIVGGESMMYPGDSSLGASASNLVNCRCSQHYIPVEPDYEEEGQQPLYSPPNLISYLKNLLKGILNIKW